MGTILSVIQTLVVLSLVIVLANVSLKLLNKYTINQGNIIKIWEKTTVNTNSSIGIVEVSGVYYLMSFTQNENKILKELDVEEIEEMLKEKEEGMDLRENSLYKKIGSFIEERKRS